MLLHSFPPVPCMHACMHACARACLERVLAAALHAAELPEQAPPALLPVPGLAAGRLQVARQLAVHARHLFRHRHRHLQPARRLVAAKVGDHADRDDGLPTCTRSSTYPEACMLSCALGLAASPGDSTGNAPLKGGLLGMGGQPGFRHGDERNCVFRVQCTHAITAGVSWRGSHGKQQAGRVRAPCAQPHLERRVGVVVNGAGHAEGWPEGVRAAVVHDRKLAIGGHQLQRPLRLKPSTPAHGLHVSETPSARFCTGAQLCTAWLLQEGLLT